MGAVLEFLFEALIESALYLWIESWPRWLRQLLCITGIALLVILLCWAFL